MSISENKTLATGKTSRSLIAYAFLAQATRSEGDLLTGLAPIFKPIARKLAGKRFDPAEFAKTLGEIYGLKVSPWAIEDMAPRLENARLLSKVMLSEGVHEYVYAEPTGEFDEVSDKDIAILLKRFVDFAQPLTEQHGLEMAPDQLEQAFLRQLVDMEFVGILIKPETVPAPERTERTITLNKSPSQVAEKEHISRQARLDVLCASFILDTYLKDPPLYALILRVATGALVSEVVLNFQDPGADVSLGGLTVVLDTPFLMAALDLSDTEARLVAEPLCKQLQEKDAQLAVFSHSVDELKDNLKAVMHEVDAGRGHGATARRLAVKSFNSYANSVMQNTEARLKQDSIKIITPLTSATSHQYFTSDDEDEFARSLGYYNKLSQERDAASVAGIIRLRANRRARMGQFPSARYIFLTSNPRLAERAHQYLVARKICSEGDVPAAISDRHLAGLMWVVYGGKAKELPSHVLLANCAKAIEPRSDVIRQMHKFLSELDPKKAEFFEALMTKERSGQHLMQLTLGESAFLTKDNVSAILEQMTSALVEKQRLEMREHIQRITGEHESIEQELRRDLLAARTRELQEQLVSRERNQRITDLEQSIAAVLSERTQNKKKLVERCVRYAIGRTNTLHWIVSAAAATLGTLVGWFGMLESSVTMVKGIGAGMIWIISFAGFWKIPDRLLGGWMSRFREKVYREKLRELGDAEDDALFEIDWGSGSVSTRLRPNGPSGAETTQRDIGD